MLVGDPTARAVQFFLDSEIIPLHLMGDGLLPVDVDGNRAMVNNAPAPIIGTQDDDAGYGATFDALNIWELDVKWDRPWASLSLKAQIPVASFDSVFPCGVVPGSQPPNARDCLPQPGVTDGSRFLDILSYRQRPTWRLAYRYNGLYETMVTNQSVEARPGIAGVRWYEIRRTKGVYSLYQQGTYAPDDGVHRWMGSAATDKRGNIALGYSVVNGVDVFPGIRYVGRTFGTPLGQMNLAEGTIINGTDWCSAHHQLPLGRLHLAEHRPGGRLHFLVRQRVLHRCRPGQQPRRLADPHRQLQAARLPVTTD
jgi:hypothetical protein